MSGPAGTAVELYRSVDSALSGVEEVVNSVCKTLAWPLIQLVDLVDGDPETIRARAAEWDALAAEVRTIAADHAAARAAEAPHWNADSGRAYDQRLVQTEEQLTSVADEFAATAEYLRAVAEGLQITHDILVEICIEFVNWLLVTLITAFVTMWFTAGASWAVAVGAATVRGMAVFARAARLIARLMTKLKFSAKQIDRVMDLLKAIDDKLRALATKMYKLENHLSKLENKQLDDLIKGGKYADKRPEGTEVGTATKVWDSMRGTFKLGKSGSPFDMGLFDRITTIKNDGLVDGGWKIADNVYDNAKWNVPNTVIHGAAWGTTALVTGLSIPGADLVKDEVQAGLEAGSTWIDENVFGQEQG